MDSQQRRISEFPPYSPETSLRNTFLLCIDNNAFSGEFTLHEALIKLLRDGQEGQKEKQNSHRVFLISTTHSRSHYEAILKKNAFDLKQLESSGRIFIHYMMVGDDQAKSCWSDLISWQAKGMPFPPSKERSSETEEHSLCVVIDDLDALEMLSPDSRSARVFMSKLISSVSRCTPSSSSSPSSSSPSSSLFSSSPSSSSPSSTTSSSSSSSRILTLAAYSRQPPTPPSYSSSFFPSALSVNCVGSGENQFEPTLTEYSRYRCDISVAVSSLTSGYSSEVHGLFTVTNCSAGGGWDAASNQSTAGVSDVSGVSGGGGSSGGNSVGGNRNNVNYSNNSSNSNSSSKNNKLRGAIQKHIVHYKAMDTGVRCCLANNA